MQATKLVLLLITSAAAVQAQRTVRISSARQHHSGAHYGVGQVLTWGSGTFGELGNGLPSSSRNFADFAPRSLKTVGIAGGSGFSLQLLNTGSVIAWGLDNAGQLGDGPGAQTFCSTLPCSTQVFVKGVGGTGLLSRVVAIAGGGMHSLAVRSDGTVVAWGANPVGEIGNPAAAGIQDVPIQVAGVGGAGFLAGVVAVAGGEFHSLALKSDGTVVAWGGDDFGQLGRGPSTGPARSPVQVKGIGGLGFLTNVVAIAAGQNHNLALRSDGTLVAWGQNSSGELGTGAAGAAQTTPVLVTTIRGLPLDHIIAVKAGSRHTVALRSDGTVLAWGDDTDGQLGNGGSLGSQAVPRVVTGVNGVGNLADVISVDAGSAFSVALRADGTVVSWGANSSGELGSGIPSLNQQSPVVVQRSIGVLSGIATIAAAHSHCLALVGTGNETSALGLITAQNPGGSLQSPATAAMAAGNLTTFVVQLDGTVLAKGANSVGQLGIGTTDVTSMFTPVKGVGGVGVLTNVVAIAPSALHTLALRSDGTVVAWGSNAASTLGNGVTGAFSTVPVQVVGPTGAGVLNDIVAIAAGRIHSLALKSDGTVWAWGSNDSGQRGSGPVFALQSIPVQVSPQVGVPIFNRIVAIAAGDQHSLALRSDGVMFSWGDDVSEELGNGPGAPESCTGLPCSTRPVPVMNGEGIISISSRGRHALALRHNGTVISWGADDKGQLGDSPLPVNQAAPVGVVGVNGIGLLTGVTAIEAGFDHSVAFSDGLIFSWGDNTNAQLGDGTNLNRAIPVKMVQTLGLFFSPAGIAAGRGASLVLYGYEIDL